jgi:hypothetical protein
MEWHFWEYSNILSQSFGKKLYGSFKIVDGFGKAQFPFPSIIVGPSHCIISIFSLTNLCHKTTFLDPFLMLRHPIVIDNNKLRPSNRCDGPRPIPVPM